MITRHQKANWKSYCSEPLELVENYKQAEADGFEGWCMHHRREIKLDGTIVSAKELIDHGLYFGRPASELVFMKVCEHSTLHSKGKHHSEETRKKLSEARKGKNLGVHWWNNGISSKRSRECPGEGWNHGRLMLSIS